MKKYPPLLFPLVLVFYEIVTYFSNDMYLPGLPQIEADFNISQELSQYTLLTWFLGSAIMQMVMGPLADRFGRRKVILTGGIFYIISSWVCAVTDNITIMLVSRFVQGINVCAVVVPGYATIHELYESKTAIKVLAIMGSIVILAPAFGPIIGAVVIELSNWRAIFYLLALLSALCVVLLYFVMPETMINRQELNIKQIAKDYRSIVRNSRFIGYALPFSLLFTSVIAWLVESPFLIIENYQRSDIIYGLIQVWVFGGFFVGAQITNYLINHFVPVQIIRSGMIFTLMSAAVLFFASLFFASHLSWMILWVTLTLMGVALCFSPLTRLAVEACQEPMGSRMAIFFTFMNFFGAFATFAVSLLKISSMIYLSLFMLINICLGVCTYFYFAAKQS